MIRKQPMLRAVIEFLENLIFEKFYFEKTEKENYCVYTDKFHIARNQSFDCSDQYLGVIVKIPEHYENGTRTDKIEQVFCYLTTHSTGEYTFLESKQLKSISNCDAVKQLYIFFMSYIFKIFY